MENLTINELIKYIKENWEKPDVFPDLDSFLMNRTPINLLLFAQEIYTSKKVKE